MKLKSSSGWKYDRNGINWVGFNALPSGWSVLNIPESYFYGLGDNCLFMSSTLIQKKHWARGLYGTSNGIERRGDINNTVGRSIRCVKND